MPNGYPSPELEIAKRTAAGTSYLTPSQDAAVDPNKPNYTCQAYLTMKPKWIVMEDVNGGTDAMRLKCTSYMPQMPLEHIDDYKQRVKGSEFFAATARTVRGLVGMVFRRPPKLGTDINETLAQHWENIDGAGTNGEVFTREAYEAGMLLGHGAILVDYPVIDNNVKITLADEREAGVRPYWCFIKPEQILSWRNRTKYGQTELSQVVIRECTLEPVGAFGEDEVERYRVFTLNDLYDPTTNTAYTNVSWEVWEWQETDNKRDLVKTNSGSLINGKGKPMSRIPVTVFFTGPKLGWFSSSPPLLDLAHTNIAHWNVQSDHRHSLHKASIPLLVGIGRDTSEAVPAIGVNAMIDMPLGSDLKYVEHTGSALSATAQELKDIETRMAALGLAMLQSESRASETARARRIDKSEQDSALSSSARSLQDAIEEAFSFHAEYLGLPLEQDGSVLVNNDFEDLTPDPQAIAAFSALHLAGQISLDTLWTMLEQNNALPDDFDRDEEKLAVMAEEADRAAQALTLATAAPQPTDLPGNTPGSKSDTATPAKDTSK
jgi:hypothetical protein